MNQTINKLTLLLLISCGQSNPDKVTSPIPDTANINSTSKVEYSTQDYTVDDLKKQVLSGFKKATIYNLTDTLTADLNGDGVIDKAFLQKENGSLGIVIWHGKTNEQFRIGFGRNFASWTDFDVDWVDYWGLVEDNETSETIFSDDGEVLKNQAVKLQNPSILLGKYESGGGLITFRNGKYDWVHQTC